MVLKEDAKNRGIACHESSLLSFGLLWSVVFFSRAELLGCTDKFIGGVSVTFMNGVNMMTDDYIVTIVYKSKYEQH